MFFVCEMLNFVADQNFFELLGATLILSIARTSPLIFVNPIFSRHQFQSGFLQMSIIIAISAPIFPTVFIQLNAYGIPTPFLLVVLVLKEIVIGLVIAILLSVPFWAVDSAGKIIENAVGFSPASEGEISGSIGNLFLTFAFVLLFFTGLYYELILDPIYKSIIVWPPFAAFPSSSDTILLDLVEVLQQISESSFIIALPIVALLLLSDLIAGFVLKYTQAISPSFLMLSLKPLILIILLFPFVTVLLNIVKLEYRELLTVPEVLQEMLPPKEWRWLNGGQ
ncbi:Bacterial export protein, family 1 [Roseibium sp. TrichSKD4]|nr:Bacterial export protein, family 1 [Roseibium sp. TrichSKD4]